MDGLPAGSGLQPGGRDPTFCQVPIPVVREHDLAALAAVRAPPTNRGSSWRYREQLAPIDVTTYHPGWYLGAFAQDGSYGEGLRTALGSPDPPADGRIASIAATALASSTVFPTEAITPSGRMKNWVGSPNTRYCR